MFFYAFGPKVWNSTVNALKTEFIDAEGMLREKNLKLRQFHNKTRQSIHKTMFPVYRLRFNLTGIIHIFEVWAECPNLGHAALFQTDQGY